MASRCLLYLVAAIVSSLQYKLIVIVTIIIVDPVMAGFVASILLIAMTMFKTIICPI